MPKLKNKSKQKPASKKYTPANPAKKKETPKPTKKKATQNPTIKKKTRPGPGEMNGSTVTGYGKEKAKRKRMA